MVPAEDLIGLPSLRGNHRKAFIQFLANDFKISNSKKVTSISG